MSKVTFNFTFDRKPKTQS